MSDEIKLKPCPFCGSRHIESVPIGRTLPKGRVECCDCGVNTNEWYSEGQAIKRWNLRAWVDVNELPPPENVPVFVMSEAHEGMIGAAKYVYEDEGWHWEQYNGFGFLNDPDSYEWDDDYQFTLWKAMPIAPEQA